MGISGDNAFTKTFCTVLPGSIITRDTYTQCRASRSELVRLKVLVCEHDCCNRSMHGTVLGNLDGGRTSSSSLLIELYYAALPVVRALWEGMSAVVRQRSDTNAQNIRES